MMWKNLFSISEKVHILLSTTVTQLMEQLKLLPFGSDL